MKIGSAFPHILERRYPTVYPTYPLLTVLYLLQMKDVDAVPLTSSGGERARAVFGYSSLPHLMTLEPKNFSDFLRGPCERASDLLPSLAVDEELGSLLDAFKKRRLGFALVHGGPADQRQSSLVNLADVLELFEGKQVHADMKVEDVATRIFSMPGKTPIRSALQAMFAHRFRRVFISTKGTYVSERSIIDRVFSPDVLEAMGEEGSKDVLAAPIDTVAMSVPISVGPRTDLRSAALRLSAERGQCLVVGGNRVVTPWDIVMKPWAAGRLAIEE